MHRITNLTNSPHHIHLADGGRGRIAAHGQDDFDVAPKMLPYYERCGFLQLKVIDTPADDQATDDDEKDALIAQLAELGVKKDRRSSVESLQAALSAANEVAE